MSRAARRRKAKQAERDARSAAVKRTALAVYKRRQRLYKEIAQAPAVPFRTRAYQWGRAFMLEFWEREIWLWRLVFQVSARIIGVDPDEKVEFGPGNPRDRHVPERSRQR
jgi:hypothetical protein